MGKGEMQNKGGLEMDWSGSSRPKWKYRGWILLTSIMFY